MTSFRVTSISFAHPATPTEERSAIALTGARLAAALERVQEVGVDVFVLSTCLRTEIASVGCDRALRRVLELLYHGLELPGSGVIRFDRDAVHHLYRVAAGIDSPIVGEPEVLGQFRSALDAAREHGGVGGLFDKLLQTAVNTGRQARKLLPETATGSMALVAAEIAAGAPEVSVFGAGAMARAAVETLRGSTPAPRVTVYARRPEAVRFETDDVRHLSEAPKALAESPVVISATSAKRELFDGSVLEEALAQRRSPLLLVDLAMPPDFSPGAATSALRYYDLDSLADRVRRQQASDEVEAYLEQAAGESWAKLTNHHEVGPVIAAILEEARRAVEEEVQRFSGRLQIEPENLGALTQLAQTVAHRVLHRPLSYLSSDERGASAAPIFAEVFGVAGGD
jgi:glutamyl-tRNA reductase